MIRYIFLLFISLFVISCDNNKTIKDDNSKKISLTDSKKSNLKDVISKIEVIELPRIADAYFAGYDRFLVKDDLFIIKDRKGTLFVFGKDGNFISNSANKIGKGEEEYYTLLAYTYNNFTKEIEVVTPTGIKKYDKMFNFKGKIDFSSKDLKTLMFDHIYDISDHEHILISILEINKKGENNIYIYDSKRQEIVKKYPYPAECPYITMQEQCVTDGNFFALPSMNYSFYQINKTDYSIEKILNLDFGNNMLKESDYANRGNRMAIQSYLAHDCKKYLPLRTFRDKNKLVSIVKAGPKRSDFRTYIVNLDTSESTYLSYDDGNIKTPLFEAFSDGVLYACVAEDEIMDTIDESLLDAKSKSVVEKHTDESNYYIVKYHLK